jgi:hypothetical protein
VHLAQAFGLDRLRAVILAALVGLDAHPALDRAYWSRPALKLRIVRLAIAPRFMRTITSVHRAFVVFFAHKKAPISSRMGILVTDESLFKQN